jgi:hypothetical protein
MTTDGYATGFCGMFELSMTSFRYYQSPPVRLEQPNHFTYLHDGTISEEKNQAPGMSSFFATHYCVHLTLATNVPLTGPKSSSEASEARVRIEAGLAGTSQVVRKKTTHPLFVCLRAERV